jgi:hypothetical protein
MISLFAFVAFLCVMFARRFFHYKFLRAQADNPMRPEEYSRVFEELWGKFIFPISSRKDDLDREMSGTYFIFGQPRNEAARQAKFAANSAMVVGIALMAVVLWWAFL